MTNGLHQVGLAHSDPAVEEERVVGLRRTLRNRLAGGVGELIAAANDESIKGVAGIQLCGTVPIEARLRNMEAGSSLRGGRKPAVVPHGSRSRIIVGSDELHVSIIHIEIIQRFLDQVSILVADVAELHRGHTHIHDPITGMAVARGFQPGVVGMTIDFLFERIQDAQPRICTECRSRYGHKI